MDPRATLNELRNLAYACQMSDHADAERLSELFLALDEWRENGGFDPYLPEIEPGKVPNHAQALALGRITRDFGPLSCVTNGGGAGLPDDYVFVRAVDGFECGIDPTGRVSS